MHYTLSNKEAFRVVGLKIPLTEEHEKNSSAIAFFWKELIGTKAFHQICRQTAQDFPYVLGISAYLNPANIFYYIAAITNASTPMGFEEFIVPEATWCIVSQDACCIETYQSMFRGLFMEFLPSPA